LLTAFSAAVVANDGTGLAGLFTADGIYADEFFGVHQARRDRRDAAALSRYGRDYRWDFNRSGQRRDNRLRPVPLQLRLASAGVRGPAGGI